MESRPRTIKKVYLSEQLADEFRDMMPAENKPRVGEIIEVLGINDLESCILDLWPLLIKS